MRKERVFACLVAALAVSLATPAPAQDEPAPPVPPTASVRGDHGELGEVIVLALSLGALLGFAAVRLGRLRSEP